jgi:hypothetical protein
MRRVEKKCIEFRNYLEFPNDAMSRRFFGLQNTFQMSNVKRESLFVNAPKTRERKKRLKSNYLITVNYVSSLHEHCLINCYN